MSEGWIYILQNPSHKQDLFKIGKTTLCPDKRAAELSKPTGVADKFKVVFKIDVFDCDIAEKQIHKKLDKFRNNPGREFFELPRAEAIETVITIANKIGKASSLECEVSEKTLKDYLNAKYPNRESISPSNISTLVKDLISNGYSTIRDLERDLSKCSKAFNEYEKKDRRRDFFSQEKLVLIALEILYPEFHSRIGKKRPTGGFFDVLGYYRSLVMDD